MTDQTITPDLTAELPAGASRRMRIGAALMAPAPLIALGVLLAVLGDDIPLLPLLLGAVGWLIALALRQPVALVAMRVAGTERAGAIVGWFSGPAEELVRLALVLLVLRTLPEAVWAGYGWAAVEVLLIMVNLLALANLLGRDDEKSREARDVLAAQGMLRPYPPVWALVERLSATAMHIAFTILLFVQPWLVLVTLPLHSIANMLAAKYAKTHLVLTELALAAIATVTLVAAIALALA